MSTEQISVSSVQSPDNVDPDGGRTRRDWHFARQPFWIFSHLFAFAVVALFVALGFWQLDRLDQRQAENALISARTAERPLLVDSADIGLASGGEADFRPAVAVGTIIDDDVVRVANRSQGGVAGEYVVALLELGDGTLLAVNRGFVPINTDAALLDSPTGVVELTGWLRATVEPEGWFAVADTGAGEVMPRLDTTALSARIGEALPPYALQLAPDGSATAEFPDPVALPELSEGPHLSYAVQWFIFAVLGTIFYLAVVLRRAGRDETGDVPA